MPTRIHSLLFCLTLCLAALPATARQIHDLEYAHPDGESLRMDGYIPDSEGPHPAVVIVHGGAWIGGDKGRNVEPLFGPLEEAGFAWFSINYRLADRNDLAALLGPNGLTTVTGASDDVRSAVAFLKQEAGEFDIDPEQIVLIGESAGAHLAELAALAPGIGGPVAGIVGFYGPSDLALLAQTSDRIPARLRETISNTPLAQLLMAGLAALSPRYLITPEAPPFLLLHGTQDPLVPFDQSVDMCNAVLEAGVACELYPVLGGSHGLRGWETEPEGSAYKSRMIQWLRDILRRQ